MKNLLMNIKTKKVNILKTKYKVMILIGSAIIIGFSLWNICHIGMTAHASTVYEYSVDNKTVVPVTDGVSLNIDVATAGDAKYQDTTRDITDVYNLLMLINIELMFWIMWNLVRSVYRILCDFKKF